MGVDAFGPPSDQPERPGRPVAVLGEGATLAGAPEVDILQAATGSVRLALGMKTDGRSFLDLRDQRGKVRTVYALDQNELPLLEFHDTEEKPRAVLFMKADETPKLVFLNKNRNGGFAAGLTSEGAPAVQFGDQTGQQRIALGIKEDTPTLTLNDLWPTRMELGATPRAELSALDPEGKAVAQVPR